MIKHMQILELGIVLHSVILGISLGVSRSAKTIKPLVAVLTIHQCFEGIGLGGCISQVSMPSFIIRVILTHGCLKFLETLCSCLDYLTVTNILYDSILSGTIQIF